MSVARTLGIVPARGGSKGIPDKNLRPLAGKPLLQYARDVACASGAVDRLIVSTDSEEIAALARRLDIEVPFLRPAELARDDTPMLPVLQHAVAALEADGWSPEIVVLLQPTAPLRKREHIADAVNLLRSTHADAVVSAVRVPAHFSPDYVMRIDDDGRLVSFLPEGARLTRRQDARPAYFRDGTIYVMWRTTLMDKGSIYGEVCVPLVLDESESITIDTPADWAEAERRLSPD